ncbi:MAG: hypothetical protein EOL87_06965 [Spartobacteria bacterium]|nr:hypothetical protein [Spartobacteria bacterium]
MPAMRCKKTHDHSLDTVFIIHSDNDLCTIDLTQPFPVTISFCSINCGRLLRWIPPLRKWIAKKEIRITQHSVAVLKKSLWRRSNHWTATRYEYNWIVMDCLTEWAHGQVKQPSYILTLQHDNPEKSILLFHGPCESDATLRWGSYCTVFGCRPRMPIGPDEYVRLPNASLRTPLIDLLRQRAIRWPAANAIKPPYVRIEPQPAGRELITLSDGTQFRMDHDKLHIKDQHQPHASKCYDLQRAAALIVTLPTDFDKQNRYHLVLMERTGHYRFVIAEIESLNEARWLRDRLTAHLCVLLENARTANSYQLVPPHKNPT